MADDLTRSHLAKVALAAWVNVPVDQLPQDKMWIEHPCDLNRQAWDRVVSAILDAARAQGPGEAVEAIIAKVSDEDLRALASTYDTGKCRAVLRTVLRDALAATPTREA